MKTNILFLATLLASSVLLQADLIHRYRFEGGVSDRIGGIDGAPTTATTNTEAPLYPADVPAGTVFGAPAQSMEVGMDYGSKKSGFVVKDESIISLTQGAYSLLMKADSMSGGDYIFAALSGASGPKIVGRDATTIRVSAGSPIAKVDLTISSNTWHHVVVAWDNVAGDLVVYLDGQPAWNGTFEPFDIAPTSVRVGTFSLGDNTNN